MYVKLVYAIHVGLQAPYGNEIHIEVLSMVKSVQILEIDHNLVWENAKENLSWDMRGDCSNALLHCIHDPSMQLIQFLWALHQIPPIQNGLPCS